MARPASLAVAGYYPTPPHLLSKIARLIDASATKQGVKSNYNTMSYGEYLAFDPCAGDGEAVLTFCQHLFTGGDTIKLESYNKAHDTTTVQVIACELEPGRSKALAQNLIRNLGIRSWGERSYNCDAFQLTWSIDPPRYRGASILYLNPPYGLDRVAGRLEHKFLERFTPTLIPDQGILVFIVPHYALEASALYLAQHYEDISCFRFPDPDFDVFKQVVLVARRGSNSTNTASLVDLDNPVVKRIKRWADDPTAMETLYHHLAKAVVHLPGNQQGAGFAKMSVASVDLKSLLAVARPWQVGNVSALELNKDGRKSIDDVGLAVDLTSFMGQPWPVAMPPKPAHIAAALAAGIFNGKQLNPNRDAPSTLPPILVKGVFQREYRTIEERKDEKSGKTTSMIQIQQPSLVVTALSLSDYQYYSLHGGERATGNPRLSNKITEGMNIADLLTWYSEALVGLLRQQFPALHNPSDPTHVLPLPALNRTLYTVQTQAVQGLLKLLANGQNPLLVGEVGTGKTTMALTTIASLSTQHYHQTIKALEALGFSPKGLKPVKRVLVMCPPHLLSTWEGQIKTVLPNAKIKILETVGDVPLTPPATDKIEIYILSRETAKLGSGLATGTWQQHHTHHVLCPRCGQQTKTSSESEILSGRARCTATTTKPSNGAARVAMRLAKALMPLYPTDETVQKLLKPQGRMVEALRVKGAGVEQQNARAAYPGFIDIDLAELHSLLKSVGGLIDTAYRYYYENRNQNLNYYDSPLTWLLTALESFCLALPYDDDEQHQQQPTPIFEVIRNLWNMTLHNKDQYGVSTEVRQRLIKLLVITGASYGWQPENKNQWAMLYQELSSQLQQDNKLKASCASTWARLELTLRYLKLQQEEASQVASGLQTPQEIIAKRRWQGYRGITPTDTWECYRIDLETGKFQLDKTEPLDPTNLIDALKQIIKIARFNSSVVCGEPLYQLIPKPRRYPLARYILRKSRQAAFDFVVLDEAHELNNETSAQSKAGHRLVSLPGCPTLALTGSLMGGYASGLFANFWALSGQFRQEFGRNEKQRFVDRFGYRKMLAIPTEEQDRHGKAKTIGRSYGTVTDREEQHNGYILKQLGEAPGVLPLFILKHLLPSAVLVHKEDLDTELPPLLESSEIILPAQNNSQDDKLLAAYRTLQQKLVTTIRQDILNRSQMAGKLWGAVAELPGYLDLASEETGNRIDQATNTRQYRIEYPDQDKTIIAVGESFPNDYLSPKERWLLAKLRAELAEGRDCIVFLRHTGDTGAIATEPTKASKRNQYQPSPLVGRLASMIEQELKVKTGYLDSKRVKPSEREAWIDREVIAKGVRVLLLNPNTVKTGLNNLVGFSTAVWYELDYSALTYRQANGRLHRIGQTNPVRIYYPFYLNTAQEVAFDLLASKVSASLQVDGISMESALEAAGAATTDGGQFLAAQQALTIGRAIYEVLSSKPATQQKRYAEDVVLAPTPIESAEVEQATPLEVVPLPMLAQVKRGKSRKPVTPPPGQLTLF